MNETTRYASRKFILCLFTLVSATALVYNKSIADVVYSAVMIASLGAYNIANVVQKVLGK